MMVPEIAFRHLDYAYDNKVLFSDFSADIPTQQLTVILGPSGVGKTTLLRLLSGLEVSKGAPNAVMVSDQQPLLGRISYLAQQPVLFPWLNVRDNILMSWRLQKDLEMPANTEDFFDELVSCFGLTSLLNKKSKQLSGGQQKLVMLARVLLEQRSIVLLDEPFAALDTPTRYRLQKKIVTWLSGKTVVLITHDPLTALHMGDVIWLLKGAPVKIEQTIQLASKPPRDLRNDELVSRHIDLLQTLMTQVESA